MNTNILTLNEIDLLNVTSNFFFHNCESNIEVILHIEAF